MKKAKIIINKILHPPAGVIIILPVIAFAGVIYVFACGDTRAAPDYVFYALSAYSLVILVIGLSKRIPEIKNKIHAFIVSVKFLNRGDVQTNDQARYGQCDNDFGERDRRLYDCKSMEENKRSKIGREGRI